ncbi:MAG: hypothetical protein H7263_05195, partial [Candidatus Sericytochromatia bacterium]|nr:hypothetical protein [Candidatus Sericytochromatia bacterium]
MQKKEIKGFISLALSLSVVVLAACGTKTPVKIVTPTKAPIQSINAADINIPGFDNTTTTPTTNPTDNAIPNTGSTDPTNTSSASPASSASSSIVASGSATVTTSASPAIDPNAVATAPVDPNATVTSTATATALPTPTPIPTITPLPTPTPVPTPTPTPVPTPTQDPRGNANRSNVADGLVLQPRGIDVRNGKIYVSDYYKASFFSSAASGGAIQIVDSSGTISKTISGTVGDALPSELAGVATDGARVFTANRIPYAQSQNNVYSFNTSGDGRQNSKLGLTGASGTDFQDIAIDTTNHILYIASNGTSSVIKVSYDTNGTNINTQQIYFSGATQ